MTRWTLAKTFATMHPMQSSSPSTARVPRVHLFEFNDSAWAPGPLRETIVEALSRTLAWGRILEGLAAPFARFIAETGSSEVLDLCAGAGAPAATLVDELERAGVRAPRFILTDLHPHPRRWRELALARSHAIDAIDVPVDARAIPPSLGRDRARVVVNAFHHFPPAVAAEILMSAAQEAPGIFVAECFERAPLVGFMPFALAGLPAILANPLLAPQHKLAKVALTWLSPIALGVSAWDGFVSTLRVYDERELRRMVAGVAGVAWTYGTFAFFPRGRGYYFYGVRQR